jgi:hypothetical protein
MEGEADVSHGFSLGDIATLSSTFPHSYSLLLGVQPVFIPRGGAPLGGGSTPDLPWALLVTLLGVLFTGVISV